MRILFVCVGNTCRSQMAEGWARHLGLEAASAGTHPGPSVAKNAVIVMAEIGIDISSQVPSHIDDFDHSQFDKVFSMGCGVSCPNIPLVKAAFVAVVMISVVATEASGVPPCRRM